MSRFFTSVIIHTAEVVQARRRFFLFPADICCSEPKVPTKGTACACVPFSLVKSVGVPLHRFLYDYVSLTHSLHTYGAAVPYIEFCFFFRDYWLFINSLVYLFCAKLSAPAATPLSLRSLPMQDKNSRAHHPLLFTAYS